jgi:Lrp/AsnC family leucine-responsive transcriptional regulator
MRELDDVDRKLLEILQKDGRTTYGDLSEAVGLAASSVNERVRKLHEQGIIEAVQAHVSPEALRLELLAFIFVGWNEPSVEPRFLARIAQEQQILECHHVTGAWNYLLKVRVRNTRMLEGLLANVIKAVSGVERTETLIVLSSTKETSILPTAAPTWFT